jgi:dihydropteroate synthase
MLAPPGEDRSSSLRGGNGRSRTRIMGILNVTPDSFSDGGRFNRLDAAVAQARKMAAEGADIIDVGGESTRPGYLPIDADEELARVLPVLEAIVPIVGIPVSIDTRKSAVARVALRAGARMVNDIWGLQRDPTLAELAAEADVETIAMHNRDTVDPAIDIIDDMLRFFEVTIDIARRAGIREDRLILDPGIGFGKTLEQNLRAVKHIGAIRALGFPVLLGVSRKSSIGRITGREVGDRLAGTIAMNAWALRDGVDIIRVHDVAEHVDARAISEALRDA